MDFEWDDAKSAKNLRDRGFSFAVAALIFDGPTLEWCDVRQAWGEARVVAVGLIEGRVRTVIYTERNNVRRILSARRARKKEEEQWRWCVNP